MWRPGNYHEFAVDGGRAITMSLPSVWWQGDYLEFAVDVVAGILH